MKVNGFMIVTGIIIITLSSCKKAYRCEKWEVSDSCTETGNCYYLGCNSFPSGVHQVELCGNELNDARPNNTITISTNCTIRTRTFIRKL